MSPKYADDDLLLKMLDAGDKRAVDMLFKQHYKRLYHIVASLTHDTTVTRDILQDLFVNIWEKRRSLNIRKPIVNYLIKASVHRALNHLRYKKTHKTIYLEETNIWLESDMLTDAPLEHAELKSASRSAVKNLSPRTRIAYILRTSFRMNYKEIAEYMGVSKKGVGKHISKAYKKLRLALKQYLQIFL